jgi:hypothetical protein
MGSIYEAYDGSHDRRVVLKIFPTRPRNPGKQRECRATDRRGRASPGAGVA